MQSMSRLRYIWSSQVKHNPVSKVVVIGDAAQNFLLLFLQSSGTGFGVLSLHLQTFTFDQAP